MSEWNKNNLTKLEGKLAGVSEFKKAVDELVKERESHLELQKIRAELKKNYYDHLVKQGFSKEEALDIVKTDTSM